MRKRWAGGLVAAVIVVALVTWWALSHRAQPVQAVNAAPSVPVATAHMATFAVRVAAQGRIGPPAGSSAGLAFAEAGTVRAIDVHVGDAVTSGQPLAELRQAGFALGVDSARAEAAAAAAQYGNGSVATAAVASARAKVRLAALHLETLRRGGEAALSNRIAAQSVARQAEIRVATDRATLTRNETLLAGGVLAQKDLDATRAQLAADVADLASATAKVSAAGADFSAALEQAQADYAGAQSDERTAEAQAGVLAAQTQAAGARFATAQLAYDNGTLRAPSNGVILAILKHPGEFVDSTMPVLDIGPPRSESVTLSVPADQARRIRVGDRAELALLQRSGSVERRVTAVVPAVDPSTLTTTVVIDGVPPGAVAGDAVTATIVVADERGIVVPASAIVEDPQTGKTVVFVRSTDPTGKPVFTSREVILRASDAERAEIASGLRAGEQIAAQGGYDLVAPSG